MGDPYPATKNIETAEEMRAECALLGEGWQTLEIEHFYEWQYINYAGLSWVVFLFVKSNNWFQE